MIAKHKGTEVKVDSSYFKGVLTRERDGEVVKTYEVDIRRVSVYDFDDERTVEARDDSGGIVLTFVYNPESPERTNILNMEIDNRDLPYAYGEEGTIFDLVSTPNEVSCRLFTAPLRGDGTGTLSFAGRFHVDLD
ncbi:hypothetical protein [Pseudomonas sp. RW3S2]|uniref:hypothetical protein n=1 Tax=Pseudomonas sp. RW3S2 TaxID=485884 RepID=UPI001647DBA6|nr:hypothetical protein [Pseudomonas sp. RW3S2]MBC3418958.1 hypothetical protein [Pseudomonas sp. RW3S2]